MNTLQLVMFATQVNVEILIKNEPQGAKKAKKVAEKETSIKE